MSKRIVLTGVMIMIFCLLAGCSNSERKLIKQGNSNALAYIEGKYGFTPKIIKTESIKESNDLIGPDLNPADSGDVRVFMEYGGRNFEVQITGETVSSEGCDDYQYEEIVQAVKEALSKKLEIVPHGLTVDYGDIYYSDYDSYGRAHGKHLINSFYDGSSVKKIFENIRDGGCRANIGVITSGAGMSDINSEDISAVFGDIRLVFYNFKDDFDLNTMDKEKQETLFSPSGDDIRPYLLYMKDSLIYENGELIYKEYNPQKCGDIYYITENNGKIEEIDEDNSLEEAIGSAPELKGYKSLGRAYSIQAPADKLYIWMPVKDYADDDIVNAEYLISFSGANGREYYHYGVDVTDDGDYVSFTVDVLEGMKDIKFSLIGR